MEAVLEYLFNTIPLILAFVWWAIRLEKKITKLETDLTWIRRMLPQCQPASEDPTE